MNQLSKTSSSEEIKKYFIAILKLAKASDEYPVNFDEVWMLVYEDKKSAIRELKDKFIQGVDYQTVRKKAQASNVAGFVYADDYYLTTSCLEFFIARKVRAVFDVYRKVFHKATENAKKLKDPTVRERITTADWLAKFLNMNDSSKLLLAKSIAEPLGLPVPDYTPSKGVLKSAGELLKENGCEMSAQSFNQKMIEKGFMTELSRPSSNGGVKKFKSITGEGLTYGENQVNPSNPKSTQPLYYEEKFGDLLVFLQLKQIA